MSSASGEHLNHARPAGRPDGTDAERRALVAFGVTALFTVQRATQFLTIAPIDLRVPLRFAQGPVAVKASSNAGLPVTLSVDAGGAATLNSSGELVGIGSSGTVTLRANQAGNANVAAAPEVVLVLDILVVVEQDIMDYL